MAVLPHFPERPDWICVSCAEAWPCPTERDVLLTEYAEDLPALAVYMAVLISDAIADLPNEPAGSLYARFLGWPRAGLHRATIR